MKGVIKMSDKFIKATSMNDELSNDPAINEQREYRKNIAYTTQDIVDKLDQQRLRDIELEFMRKATREELEYSIQKLDNHAICSGNVVCPKEVKCGSGCDIPSEKEQEEVVVMAPIHGEDCHCSKCCPNPKPNFFQRNKMKIFMGVLWAALIVLAVGWSPSGATFDAIQTSYVELIVNFFKMAVFAVAGFATYKLMDNNKDKEDE